MATNFDIKKKTGYKNKVNMKSFLINNSGNVMKKHKSGVSTSFKATEEERSSQRSIVETTNAYIKAAQQQDLNNRMHYLQSAGNIGGNYAGGNGLSESDINGSRIDFLASSSMVHRPQGQNNLVVNPS